MSLETTLMTAALALLAFLLPSVAANLLRDQCIARGKLRAILFLPGLWIGYLLAAAVAVAAFSLCRIYLPAMQGSFAWIGIAFLMLFVFRSQVNRFRVRIADNDNLPNHNVASASFRLGWQAFRPSLIIALWAVLLQLSDSLTNSAILSQEIALPLAVAALVAPLIQLALAERSARKLRAFRKVYQASHKPRTRFIASRAVTAGYRKIAA
ncbi:hypothetical protein MUU53_11640 [Rhizobium lemnae]|uniref:DUF1295 domain-containing protein n=1 Tax=Rhizobium lemnae TaxID=1214924 RepID=A0ABV8EDH9_9HYPH|nr:hypothetical protein [Rhizobium lemnae]MCJ8508564.1 hypothetical protein [Rhizobium lemnae]